MLGSEIRQTKRSAFARQRYKSFDGGRRDVSFYNASKINVFPRNAITDKRLFVEDKKKIQCFPDDERSVQIKALMALLRCALSVEFCIANRVLFLWEEAVLKRH